MSQTSDASQVARRVHPLLSYDGRRLLWLVVIGTALGLGLRVVSDLVLPSGWGERLGVKLSIAVFFVGLPTRRAPRVLALWLAVVAAWVAALLVAEAVLFPSAG